MSAHALQERVLAVLVPQGQNMLRTHAPETDLRLSVEG